MDIHSSSSLFFKQPVAPPELIPYLLAQKTAASLPILLEKPRLLGLNSLAQEVLMKKIKTNNEVSAGLYGNQLFYQQKIPAFQPDEAFLNKMVNLHLLSNSNPTLNLLQTRICNPLLTTPLNLQLMPIGNLNQNNHLVKQNNENLDSPVNDFDIPLQRKIEIVGNKKARLHLNQRETYQQANSSLPKRNPLSKRKYDQVEDERNDDYKGRLRDRNKIKEKEEFFLPSTRKMLEKQKAKEEAEKEYSTTITIPDTMAKRDYSDYVMNLHSTEEDSVKLIQVGEEFQAEIPKLRLKSEESHSRVPKLVWNPEEQDEEKLAEYYKKIAEFIGETDINQERALKMFLRFKGETEKIIENIRKNRNHYTNYLKPILRNSKIS